MREREPRRISQVRSGEEGAKASLKMKGKGGAQEGGLSFGKFVVSFPRESFVILSRNSHESVAAGNNN